MSDRRDPPASQPFRILCLDGGGTFALIQAMALDALYPGQSGHEVLSHFDLVAGCSGGAVVTAGLLEGLAPREILGLFLQPEHRQELFGELPWHRSLLYRATRALGKPVGERYSTPRKLRFLRSVLPTHGGLALDDITRALQPKRRLVRLARGEEACADRELAVLIVTYDYDRDRARLLRSHWRSPAANFPHHRRSSVDLASAAHASSTAPVNWFDEPAAFEHGRYWDGAMTGYNNPVLAAVTEAVAMGHAPPSIAALSIGTSAVNLPPPHPRLDPQLSRSPDEPGFLADLVKLGRAIVNDPPDAHSLIAHLMTQGRLPQSPAECPVTDGRIVRLNPIVQPVPDAEGRWGAPVGWSAAQMRHLSGLDIATTDADEVALIQRLAQEWMNGIWPNQPLRAGGAFPPERLSELPQHWEVGHATFAEAAAAWRRLCHPN